MKADGGASVCENAFNLIDDRFDGEMTYASKECVLGVKELLENKTILSTPNTRKTTQAIQDLYSDLEMIRDKV